MVIGKTAITVGKWINGKWIKTVAETATDTVAKGHWVNGKRVKEATQVVEETAPKSKALVNFTTKPATAPLESGSVFTTKINFVDNKTFMSECKHGLYLTSEPEMASEFYTEGLRTCTGGGVVSHMDLEAGGFHVLDSSTTNFFLGRWLKKLFTQIKNPDSALIIGGKNVEGRPYAIPNFNTICEEVRRRVPRVTIFGEHNFRESQSHFHYSLQNNTWTINTLYKRNPMDDMREVLSVDDLHEVFKKIELAEGDALYINGKRVFL